MDICITESIVKNIICKYLDNYEDITRTVSCLKDQDTKDIRYCIFDCGSVMWITYPLNFYNIKSFKLDAFVQEESMLEYVCDKDLEYFQGIKVLKLIQCEFHITDKGLKYLEGIKVLILDGDEHSTVNITDEGLKYLEDIHTLSINHDTVNITNKGLSYLKKINTLYFKFRYCDSFEMPDFGEVSDTLERFSLYGTFSGWENFDYEKEYDKYNLINKFC